ncbi:MAG TPA: hypothetical protein VLB68_23240 [Pyrinomonadaceae bacterium]|nr:hypothetical protein [Pyrinomonadaceae bacterium]
MSQPDVAFVACIEGGVLEAQALILFESIRLYTGRFSDCDIYALSPRAGHAISSAARTRLEQLNVTYIDKILNSDCQEYGSANRVAAAAYVEVTYPQEILVILDSDTLFLREPDEFLLARDLDVLVRPVDVKGMCSSGPTDPFDKYWQDLCRCCNVKYSDIPWTETFVDHQQIKASYNGGLVIARGNLGILERWANFFFASVRKGLTPYANEWRLRSGVSWVDSTASKFWGSNQAALSLAIWSTTRRVRALPATYNYPLHLHERIDPNVVETVFPHLVHVHYHWLLEDDSNPLFRSYGPMSSEQQQWLRSRMGELLR